MARLIFKTTELRLRHGVASRSTLPAVICEFQLNKINRFESQPNTVFEHLFFEAQHFERRALIKSQQQYLQLWLDALTQRLIRASPLLVGSDSDQPAITTINPSVSTPKSRNHFCLCWPSLAAKPLSQFLYKALEFSQLLETDSDLHKARQQCNVQYQELLNALPKGTNPPKLNEAAKRRGISVHLDNNLGLRLGEGRQSRIFISSATESTSMFGMLTAKNKMLTAQRLRQRGLPTPVHISVNGQKSACDAAAKIGYPVVLKPAAEDRGNGVEPYIRNEKQLLEALARARKVSNQLILERHYQGGEFRLLVVNNRLLWAHERLPATVVGDGKHSLQQLIDQVNSMRDKADPLDQSALKPISLEATDLRFIERQGLAMNSIPRDGDEIRVQEIPSARKGGTGRAAFDEIHPDNAQLAVMAAEALNLDIVGLDVITPDISRSWRDGNLVITEVNHQPQISTLTNKRIFEDLIDELVPNQGRIPIVLCLATSLDRDWRDLLGLQDSGDSLAFVHQTNDSQSAARGAWWQCHAALSDQRVGALVAVIDGTIFESMGLPMTHIDLLIHEKPINEVGNLYQPYITGETICLGGNDVADAPISRDAADAVRKVLGDLNIDTQIRGWLMIWQSMIRDCRYDAARELFDDEVVSFGTVTDRMEGLDALEVQQWRKVWDNTQNFSFDFDTLSLNVSDDEKLVVCTVLWSSETRPDADGNCKLRKGRATLALSRPGKHWKALHSHLSITPE